MNPKSLNFRIKYGSDETRDDIMDRHQDHLHIFQNQFERTKTPITDDQYFRMHNAKRKFIEGNAPSSYEIAQTTHDPELLHHFVTDHTIYGEDVAKNPNLSSSHIHALIDSDNVYSHFNITKHPNLASDHIDRLAKHTNRDVRDMLIDHNRHKMTKEQISQASNSPNYKDPYHDI